MPNVWADTVALNVEATVTNKSVFRGTETSDVISVLPSVSTTFFDVLSVGVEATFPLTSTTFVNAEEHAFNVSLNFKDDVQLSLNDYFYPDAGGRFLAGDRTTGAHNVEATAEVMYKSFSVLGAAGFWGSLRDNYYVQVSQVLSTSENLDQGVIVFLGGGNRSYAIDPRIQTFAPVSDKFKLVNLGATVYKNKFEVSYILNLNTEVSHLVFGISF